MTLLFNRNALVLAITFAATSCGLNHNKHYQGSKTFGREGNENPPLQDNTDGPTAPQAHVPPQAPPHVAESEAKPAPQPTPEPTPPKPEHPNPDSPPDGPPPTSGHDTLSSYGLVGYFDTDSIFRIVRGSGTDGELVRGAIYDTILKKMFVYLTSDESQETLDIVTREAGKGRQIVAQTGFTANGDKLSKFKGDDSQSGVQTLYWALPASDDAKRECPKTFICVDKITWEPVKGKPWTYCMRDPVSKEALAVPYSPNPQFGPAAFNASLPNGAVTSKPFLMTKHEGLVDCATSTATPANNRMFQWHAMIGDLTAARDAKFLKKATYKPLAPDSEISVEFRPYDTDLGRGYQPKEAPFIDNMSRFNNRIRFFLNSTDHAFVKLTRTVQTSLNINFYKALTDDAAPQGMVNPSSIDSSTSEDWATYFRSWNSGYSLSDFGVRDYFSSSSSSGTTGIQIEYTHEFCTHKAIVEHPFNHCTGKTN